MVIAFIVLLPLDFLPMTSSMVTIDMQARITVPKARIDLIKKRVIHFSCIINILYHL
jgi:hypothetical protein